MNTVRRDRRDLESRDAQWTVLASLQPRRLRRTCRRQPVRRHAASAGRGRCSSGERAHYELAAGNTSRSASAAGGHGSIGRRHRSDFRASVGLGSDSRKGAISRSSQRLGSAVGLGARRTCEIVAVAHRWRRCSTRRRKPSSAICSTKRNRRTRRGGSTGRSARMPPDKTLRIESSAPATVRWSADGWKIDGNTDAPWTRASACSWPICRRNRWPPARSSSLRWNPATTQNLERNQFAVKVDEGSALTGERSHEEPIRRCKAWRSPRIAFRPMSPSPMGRSSGTTPT